MADATTAADGAATDTAAPEVAAEAPVPAETPAAETPAEPDAPAEPEDTLRVKLTTSMANDKNAWSRGDEADLPQSEAIRLIDAGYAIPVDPTAKEKAVKKGAAETR